MIIKDQPTLSSSSSSSSSSLSSKVQFFINGLPGECLCYQAHLNDTVLDIHQRVSNTKGIPIAEQKFIYNGKQLQFRQTLHECGITRDSTLHLVRRLISDGHGLVHKLVLAMVKLIHKVTESGLDFDRSSYILSYGLEDVSNNLVIKAFITKLLSMAKNNGKAKHLNIFMDASAPRALVELYNSRVRGNRAIAEKAMKYLVDSIDTHRYCVRIVFKFCKLLGRSVGTNDSLYVFCRSSLRYMVKRFWFDGLKELIDVRDLFIFINELGWKLSNRLVLSMGSQPFAGVSSDDLGDFGGFLDCVTMDIMENLIYRCLDGKNDQKSYKEINYEAQMERLHWVFKDLMEKMEMCLEKMELCLDMDENENLGQMSRRWDQYLSILKELYSISKLFEGGEKQFWGILGQRRVAFRYLIVNFAENFEDNEWIFVRKDVTSFETRMRLIMMMFPDVEDKYDEVYEMLIDRSKLLEESYEYIGKAALESFHGGLLVEFKNEKAYGAGVLREWFFLVSGAIFNPQNALFVTCPNDRRRFFPNPVSKVNPLHLKYFRFSGRIIALAMMHKIQIGIVFDRTFFAQLAGKKVSLEDIRDADPYLYNSWKTILEMDADMVDQDVLGLTFVRDIFELGTRKEVELCYGGKSIRVTSRNREEYVDLLVYHSFVKPIFQQVYYFTRGFADIVNNDDSITRYELQQSFFQSIDLEELDSMLQGSQSSLCVDDWMAHTKYVGFEETDPQIRWFWKIVGEMSAEHRRCLLFFWTSIKYLPVEGFPGLASHLYIKRSYESADHLPSSHTCFYSLIFPRYPSEKVMQNRLHIITKEHVGFGDR